MRVYASVNTPRATSLSNTLREKETAQMRRADIIEAEFPPGIKMPPELRELCDFLDRTGYPLSGYNRLRPEGESLKGWFGDGSEACRQLAGFGVGPTGSVLALWVYAGSDTTKAPVVHLGSEGDYLVVLADDFREFRPFWRLGTANSAWMI
jgi:hypothetical protein